MPDDTASSSDDEDLTSYSVVALHINRRIDLRYVMQGFAFRRCQYVIL